MDINPDDILDFWFSEENKAHWFRTSAALDGTIKDRFAAVHAQAAAGRLDHWMEQPRGALALVILLDQFTRHLQRGSAQAYTNDPLARHVARDAIGKGLDRRLADWERAFLYMPFMHSEALEDQDYSVRLFIETGLDNARYALHHRDLIRRFGRFPHRNAILGRESTPQELEYLASGQAFRG